MGRKNKLKRFAEVATFPNVYEIDPAQESFISNTEGMSRDLRGQWSVNHFQNDHPIVLELACGKGDYTVALAKDHPKQNFIGVDIKGARMWLGAKKALETSMNNVAFLRTRIEFIDRFFAPGEISEIWITFPDPFEGKITRRLTSFPFLQRYRKILKPGGIIHLKSDSRLLYEFTLDVIHSTPGCHVLYANPDIYNDKLNFPELDHKTYYEKKHLADGRTIKYLRFTI
ncbi:MAG TPA: tRNA (guanosine(46)-N7)-methyltransferase TrmB [Saprospiraceae bacterium]|nr:tRNA (guanosine(46)-N7)-methyltransferase TrmB [Saprospiraceae bacterium]